MAKSFWDMIMSENAAIVKASRKEKRKAPKALKSVNFNKLFGVKTGGSVKRKPVKALKAPNWSKVFGFKK